MVALVSRSVEIEVSNKTRNITLRNPRTHLGCGRCSVPPLPEVSPGSSDTCCFRGSSVVKGVAGVLVYEAESFTLAIYFSNPFNYIRYHMELGLELCPRKAHLNSLEGTYTRVANSPNSSSRRDIRLDRAVIVDRRPGTVQVSNGPITVRATMSSDTKCRLKVVMAEEGGWGKKAGIDSTPAVRPNQEK